MFTSGFKKTIGLFLLAFGIGVGMASKICPNCGRKMKRQFTGL